MSLGNYEWFRQNHESETPAQLRNEINHYLGWLKNDVLKRWSKHGHTEFGGSIEQFLSDGSVDRSANLRIRVQWRQLIVYSLAQAQGWMADSAILVANIRRFLDSYALVCSLENPDDSGVFAHSLTPGADSADQRQCLYDMAFQLLAYACCHYTYEDEAYERQARSLVSRIDEQLRSEWGGWHEGDFASAFRRQNPHMHLFEAFLMWYQTTSDKYWLTRAIEVFELFVVHFYQPDSKVLLEYYNEDWSLPDTRHEVVEPGHMLEWVWLLRRLEHFGQVEVDPYCQGLYHQAMALGRCSANLLWDEIDPDGEILKPTKRCWPMTEWVKASLAQALSAPDRFSYNYQEDALAALRALRLNYLTHPISGQFIDQLDEYNHPLATHAPTSTLYHFIFCGLQGQSFLEA